MTTKGRQRSALSRFEWIASVEVGDGAHAPSAPFLGVGFLFAVVWCLFYSNAVIPSSGEALDIVFARLAFFGAHALTLALVALFSQGFVRYLHDWRAVACMLVLFGAGACLVRFSGFTGNASACVAAGSCLMGACFTWIVCMWGSIMRFLDAKRAAVIVSVAMLCGVALYGLVASLMSFASFGTFCLLPVAAAVLSRLCASMLPSKPKTRKGSWAARINRSLVIYMTLFAFACGYYAVMVIHVQSGNLGWVMLFSAVALSVVFLLATVASSRAQGADFSRRIAVSSLVVVGGLLLSTFIPHEYYVVSFALVSVAVLSVDVMFWSLLATVSKETHASALSFFAKAYFFVQMGKLLGTVVALALPYIAIEGLPIADVLSIGIAYAIVACVVMSAMTVARPNADDKPAENPAPVMPAAQAEPAGVVAVADGAAEQEFAQLPAESATERACSIVAARFKLTPREAEVFGFLARGRNAAFVQKELVMSQSTAKTHIKHIYAKLGVHSSQELLDIVDRARGESAQVEAPVSPFKDEAR